MSPLPGPNLGSPFQLAKLKIELIELRESLEEAIKEEQFTKAAEVKEQIAKLEARANDLKNASQPQSQAIRVEKVSRIVHLILSTNIV